MKKHLRLFTLLSVVTFSACENRDISYGDGPNFSEIHDDINYHFDHTVIDGLDYLILERDRNNPHEGFGFMALNGKKIRQNQDSIKAYLKTIMELQVINIAKQQGTEKVKMEKYAEELFEYYLVQSKTPDDIKIEKSEPKEEN